MYRQLEFNDNHTWPTGTTACNATVAAASAAAVARMDDLGSKFYLVVPLIGAAM